MPINGADIFVYGDALDRNINNMKAYTKFELKADMAVFYEEAYGTIMDSLQEKLDAGSSIEWADLPPNAYKGSSKEKIVRGTSYTENLQASLEASYVSDKTKFGEKFFEEWEKLKGFLSDQVSKEKYSDEGGSGDESLGDIPAWMEDLITKVGQTY